MRLTCPSCGANYEVPDAVIPDEGRDVECSACGISWFQAPGAPGTLRLRPEDQSAAAPEGADPHRNPVPASALKGPSGAEAAPLALHATAEEPPLISPRRAQLQRREIEQDVLDILREEAAFEAKARARDRSAPEEPAPPAPEAEPEAPRGDWSAGLQADPVEEELPPPPAHIEQTTAGNRPRLMPDAEEMHSSVAPGSSAAPTVATPRQRRSFALGFAIPVAVVLLLLLVYAQAPALARALPGAAAGLNSYVETVDAARHWFGGR
ncbi:zinc-ribbon domain-containing protein [Pseudooceanicola sp. CBS1P-1]|uniref:Zinc finger/thioredoxin putative domain-containing protein n=1 Tax=Pseudooceanicola albus TaxID=2692189 RepID=A0A6L7G491_9RHOB|nr:MULTISPECIES: zinc-ribbon domain-containing protein [Pseudooceanicola]MBT9384826.1 zinc-ribbon domain-containing protein [Pseudooceanicola endophyticus]MXN18180.1 hypothetical protein [Pseudooceanicola albus]